MELKIPQIFCHISKIDYRLKFPVFAFDLETGKAIKVPTKPENQEKPKAIDISTISEAIRDTTAKILKTELTALFHDVLEQV